MLAIKAPNSIIMEDIYRNLDYLMNEPPPEMLICKVEPGTINPI